MDLNKKIEQIIVEKGLSPSYFADTIGIQRSSISHILSGRNKPSLDIIQRILKAFPDIDRDWLLFDSNIPEQNTPQTNRAKPVNQAVQGNHLFEKTPPESPIITKVEPSPAQAISSPTTVPQRRKIERPTVQAPVPSGKQIERIVIFYTDGTFMESKPVG